MEALAGIGRGTAVQALLGSSIRQRPYRGRLGGSSAVEAVASTLVLMAPLHWGQAAAVLFSFSSKGRSRTRRDSSWC